MTPYILAEVASSHMGDKELCRELAMLAYSAKADGVKFQVWNTEDIKGHKRFNNLKNFELTIEEWSEVVETAKVLDLDVWLEVYSPQSLENTHQFNPDFYKMSYDKFLLNPKMGEVDVPVYWRTQSDIPVYGGCVSIGEQHYPTQRQDAKAEIALVRAFNEYKYSILYADHQSAYGLMDDIQRDSVCVAAVNAGANIIEKHICMDREDLKKKSNDYHSALEPGEFKDFVQFMKQQSGKLGVIV